MAIRFSTTLQDAINGCIANAAPAGTTLNIYTGPVPATAESTLTGATLLASIPCAANFGAESGGVLTFSNTGATNEVTAVGSGTPTFFRVVGPSTSTGTGGGGGGSQNLFTWSTSLAPNVDTTAVPAPANGLDVTGAPYNADKTGAADARTAIQTALNAASSGATKTVLLPAGTYKLASMLTVPTGVTLYGVGTTSILSSATGNARAINVQGSGILYNVALAAAGATSSDSGNLNDCAVIMTGSGGRVSTVTINSVQSACVVANGASNFTIDHILVPNAASAFTDVIRIVNGATNGRVFGCHAVAPKGDHICVKSATADSAPCSQINIWSNEIDAVNGGRGIAVYGGDNITIHDNYLHGTFTGANAGIYIGNNTGFRPSTNIVIARNSSIALGGAEGMVLVTAQNTSPLSTNIRIEDNYFTTSDDAIRVENTGVGRVVISGNMLVTPGHSINFANAPTGPIYVMGNVGDPANNGPYTEFWTGTTNPGPVVKESGSVAQPFGLWSITSDLKTVTIPLATLTGYSPGATDVIAAFNGVNCTVYLSPDHTAITVWPTSSFYCTFKYASLTSGGAMSIATATLVYVWTGIDRPLGVPPGPGYHLTLNDDFDAEPGWWTTQNGINGVWRNAQDWNNLTLNGNKEDELYVWPNWRGVPTTNEGVGSGPPCGYDPFSIQNSIMTITADWIPTSYYQYCVGTGANATEVGKQYKIFSGFLCTQGAWQQTYGYFEIRALMPGPNAPVWPTFWLLPADSEWPPEIDVFENLTGSGDPTASYQTYHASAADNYRVDGSVAHIADMTKFWHIYACEWTATQVKWYVDGVLTKTTPNNDFHQPAYIIFNLAVGGDWPGHVSTTTSVFPQHYQVDWVRAWSSDPNVPVWTGLGTSGSPTAQPVRDPVLQPFNNTSVWNTPIGSGAQWSATGDADTQALIHANGAVNAGTFSNPYFIGVQSDPVKTVTCTDTGYPVAPQSIHVPAGAAPSPDSDSHMVFFDRTQPTKMWSYNGCTANSDGSGWTCSLGQVDNVCGDGIGDANHNNIGDYNFGIGTMLKWELQAGKIQHVLRFSSSRDITKSPGSAWDQNIPWPNTHEDYDGPSTYTGNLVAGSTIGIPATVDLNSLGLSAGGLVLAKALQQFGAIWRDSGGTNQFTFYAEQSAEGLAVVTQMRTDMVKIVPVIRVLRNQSPTSVNGGGTPLVAGPPVIDGTICPTVIWPGGVTSGSITGGGGTTGDSMAGSGTGGIPTSTGAGSGTVSSPPGQPSQPGGPILQGTIGQSGSGADLIADAEVIAAGQQVYVKNWTINAPGS